MSAPPDEAPATSATPSAVLEDLRGRMAALVARSRLRLEDARAERAAEIARRLALDPLPFDEEETSLGPVHVRRVVHPFGTRVGWADVHAGRTARGEDLALLALDPALASADPTRALYLDTEATGLSGGTGTIPFLIGLAWFEGDQLVAEQLLLRRLGEEAPMLARLVERLAASSMLVTFNGKSFDLPLLRTRFVMNRLSRPDEPPHFDLVHLARRIHRRAPHAPTPGGRTLAGVATGEGPTVERWDDEGARRLSSCKLVALERTLLGFSREGDIEGGEVPARYAQFLRHGDADAIRAVCDHNLWDVVSMAALVGVYADGLAAVRDAGEGLEGRSPSRLSSRDLVGLAKTLDRAGALALARRAADAAVEDAERSHRPEGGERVAGADPWLAVAARTLRGRLHKKANAVEAARDDFAHLADHHDDPSARLELAKLLEHRLKDPGEALTVVERGTTEAAEADAHRRERLTRKVRGAPQLRLDARRPKH